MSPDKWKEKTATLGEGSQAHICLHFYLPHLKKLKEKKKQNTNRNLAAP